jgi:hypothetical protein
VDILTDAAACALEATEARTHVVAGDGADGINTQSDDHVPEAVHILDWPHLCRTIQAAIRALQPGKRAARRAWRTEQSEGLFPLRWEGERALALASLTCVHPASGDGPAAFEDAVRSLQTRRDWIGTDHAWRAQGSAVGSGLVERAVAMLIHARVKKRGMCWKRAMAPAVVAFRVQRINADWDAAASPPIVGGTRSVL